MARGAIVQIAKIDGKRYQYISYTRDGNTWFDFAWGGGPSLARATKEEAFNAAQQANRLQDAPYDPEFEAEMLEALERTTTNIALLHVDYLQGSNVCAFGVDTCPCPIAVQWRNNKQLIRQARKRLK